MYLERATHSALTWRGPALCQGKKEDERYFPPEGPPEDWHWKDSWVLARAQDLPFVTCRICARQLALRLQAQKKAGTHNP